jgi:hypothetical protein
MDVKTINESRSIYYRGGNNFFFGNSLDERACSWNNKLFVILSISSKFEGGCQNAAIKGHVLLWSGRVYVKQVCKQVRGATPAQSVCPVSLDAQAQQMQSASTESINPL